MSRACCGQVLISARLKTGILGLACMIAFVPKAWSRQSEPPAPPAIRDIAVIWLGTLEAIILKMPTRYKSTEEIAPSPIYQKDEEAGKQIAAILAKFPQHKRVLFLRSKYENNETLSKEEVTELKKFSKLPGVMDN